MNLITKALLDFDVVAEVDRLCPGNSEAMLAVSFVWSEMTREHMQSIGDSHYGMTFDKMLELVHSEGFVEIYKKDFVDDDTDDGNSRTESYYVFYHSDGIILTLESYLGRVNTARMYYNIMLRNGAGHACLASYHFLKEQNAYVGDHDIRVGFRFYLNQLRANGTFLKKWAERPFLWLLTYMDPKKEGYDYKAINAEVISQFPQNVIEAITP